MHSARARVRSADLALAAAGATFYGALALVPSLLVALSLSQLLLGPGLTAWFGERLVAALPGTYGPAGATALLEAALSASWAVVLFAAVMASAYGAGLRRALVTVAPPSEQTTRPSWWVRAVTLPLLGLAPLLLVGLLVLSPLLARLPAQDGVGGTALASFVAFNVVWVLSWVPLTWTFRVVGPGRPALGAAFAGAVITGAFLSGFLQGFLLFLGLPVDLGRPFGGLMAVGVVSALLLWLWVLHLVVMLGYAFTWGLQDATSDSTTASV